MVREIKIDKRTSFTVLINDITGKIEVKCDGKELASENNFSFTTKKGEKLIFVKDFKNGLRLVYQEKYYQVIDPIPVLLYVIAAILALGLTVLGSFPEITKYFPIMGGFVGGFLYGLIMIYTVIFTKRIRRLRNRYLAILVGFIICIIAGLAVYNLIYNIIM